MTYQAVAPEEVAALNARIEELERPYHALNGHIMIRPAHITPVDFSPRLKPGDSTPRKVEFLFR